MAQICLLNRNRPNWLWVFSSVVVLLPLMLGQSSAGGCGATVTVPNPDPVDSDGDGFSDDAEHNGNPGTDPNDRTDNPNSVRNTDGDECSDYDELNFPNFCDNDPFTPDDSARACDGLSVGAFYDDEFGYGFELPLLADLIGYEDSPDFSFNAYWNVHSGDFVLSTSVTEPPETLAGDDATALDLYGSILVADDLKMVYSQERLALNNGLPAYLTVFTSVSLPGVVNYDLLTVKELRLYSLFALVNDVELTAEIEAVITDTLLSLCVN